MTIEEQLQKEGYLLSLSAGYSMRPMLTQRTEQLLIEKLTTDPSVNDVVLFKRRSGQYVLHRIIRRRGDHYLIRGDNCYGSESVAYDQIIGILKGFYKGSRYIDCGSNKTYLCYVFLWRIIYPLRYVTHSVLQWVRRGISMFRR